VAPAPPARSRPGRLTQAGRLPAALIGLAAILPVRVQRSQKSAPASGTGRERRTLHVPWLRRSHDLAIEPVRNVEGGDQIDGQLARQW
jgi:hypothetical protein